MFERIAALQQAELRDAAMDVVIPVTRARISRVDPVLALLRNYSSVAHGGNLSVTLLTIEVIGCTIIIPPVSGRSRREGRGNVEGSRKR